MRGPLLHELVQRHDVGNIFVYIYLISHNNGRTVDLKLELSISLMFAMKFNLPKSCASFGKNKRYPNSVCAIKTVSLPKLKYSIYIAYH